MTEIEIDKSAFKEVRLTIIETLKPTNERLASDFAVAADQLIQLKGSSERLKRQLETYPRLLDDLAGSSDEALVEMIDKGNGTRLDGAHYVGPEHLKAIRNLIFDSLIGNL